MSVLGRDGRGDAGRVWAGRGEGPCLEMACRCVGGYTMVFGPEGRKRGRIVLEGDCVRAGRGSEGVDVVVGGEMWLLFIG